MLTICIIDTLPHPIILLTRSICLMMAFLSAAARATAARSSPTSDSCVDRRRRDSTEASMASDVVEANSSKRRPLCSIVGIVRAQQMKFLYVKLLLPQLVFNV